MLAPLHLVQCNVEVRDKEYLGILARVGYIDRV